MTKIQTKNVIQLLYSKVFKVYSEGAYLVEEVAKLSVPKDLKNEIDWMGRQFMKGSTIMADDTGTLADLLMSLSREAIAKRQVDPDIFRTMSKIYHELIEDNSKMRALIERLRTFAAQDQKFSLVLCLCQVVGTELLKTHVAIMDILDGFAVFLAAE